MGTYGVFGIPLEVADPRIDGVRPVAELREDAFNVRSVDPAPAARHEAERIQR